MTGIKPFEPTQVGPGLGIGASGKRTCRLEPQDKELSYLQG